jgi:aspartyl-tRNA(Asn)/glutamyl-tRNA(Gln) amidotransferase subunit C
VKIELSEVQRIAALASIELDEAELRRMSEQLSSILTYMESLDRVDTAAVPPTIHPAQPPTPFREDLPGASLGAEEATRGAPGPRRDRPRGEGEGSSQFLVPRVIG